jgi:hypothetical protein
MCPLVRFASELPAQLPHPHSNPRLISQQRHRFVVSSLPYPEELSLEKGIRAARGVAEGSSFFQLANSAFHNTSPQQLNKLFVPEPIKRHAV